MCCIPDAGVKQLWPFEIVSSGVSMSDAMLA
jgi:hypothetical protein